MKNTEVIPYVQIKIIQHGLRSDGSTNYQERTLLHIYDIPKAVYERWRWVIRWRTSFLQCKYPKHTIQTGFAFYDKKTGQSLFMSPLSKLIAHKAMVTKIKNRIAEYENEQKKKLFWEPEHDTAYQNTLAKLSRYETLVKNLSEQVHQ